MNQEKNIEELKYTIESLLSQYAANERPVLKSLIARLLNIDVQMLSLYINAKKGEKKYNLSSDRLEILRRFFGLGSIDELINNPTALDESVFKAFKKRV